MAAIVGGDHLAVLVIWRSDLAAWVSASIASVAAAMHFAANAVAAGPSCALIHALFRSSSAAIARGSNQIPAPDAVRTSRSKAAPAFGLYSFSISARNFW